MQKLKKKIQSLQSQTKSKLSLLYSGDEIYIQDNIRYEISCPNRYALEKAEIMVCIPTGKLNLHPAAEQNKTAVEDFLIRSIKPYFDDINKSLYNKNKQDEKGFFICQSCSPYILRRNGAFWNDEQTIFLQIKVSLPIKNNNTINTKGIITMLTKLLPQTIEKFICEIDYSQLDLWVETNSKQRQIRNYIEKNDLVSFIGNGSILPEANTTNIKPFISPESMECTIKFADGTQMLGMGIKKGVTVITGGAYSGKSTLLDAIERGVYDHIPTDGKRFVITGQTAVKICVEDGRPITNVNLSPFFKPFSYFSDVERFTTTSASGSASQAANVVEAVCGGAEILLLDEDQSAHNFMTKDDFMRKIVRDDPITPYIDRISELYHKNGVSTVIVIGGNSEYFKYADTIIFLSDYDTYDYTQRISEEIHKIDRLESSILEGNWMRQRRIATLEKPYVCFNNIENIDNKIICIDDYRADISKLSLPNSEGLVNGIIYVLLQILSKDSFEKPLVDIIVNAVYEMKHERDLSIRATLYNHWGWCEVPRVVDVLAVANRLTNIEFAI